MTTQDLNIEIEGKGAEQVSTFQYLGVPIVDNKETQEIEIKKIIEKTINLYYEMNNQFINKKEISRITKIKVFKTIYRLLPPYRYHSVYHSASVGPFVVF